MIIKPLKFEQCAFSEIQAAMPMPGVTYNVKKTPNGWGWRCNGAFYKDVSSEAKAKAACWWNWHQKFMCAISQDEWLPPETLMSNEVEEIPFFVKIINDVDVEVCLQVTWFEGRIWPCHLGSAVTRSDKIHKHDILGWRPC